MMQYDAYISADVLVQDIKVNWHERPANSLSDSNFHDIHTGYSLKSMILQPTGPVQLQPQTISKQQEATEI